MAGTKETPRQKMVGMMYLVLTALLALNIPKEIVEAFVLVNEGLEQTTSNFEEKNHSLFEEIKSHHATNPGKYGASLDKAKTARTLSSELIAYIEEIKMELIAETEGVTKEEADTLQWVNIDGKDNYDIPTYIMIGDSEDGSDGKSGALRAKIETYKEQILNIIPASKRASFPIGLELEGKVVDEVPLNWEMSNFYKMQLAPTVTLLSRIQTEVKNIEYDLMASVYSAAEKEDFPFDTVVAKVVAPSSYVLLGEEYKADVFVAAYSTSQNPTMVVGDSGVNGTSIPVENGIGTYTVKADREGIQTYSGTIEVKNKNGEVSQLPFESEYIVARPAATISPTKMNVVYKGVKNPISVSVPGVANGQLKVSVSGGNKIKRVGDGAYEVELVRNTPRKIKVSVSAEMSNGTTRKMGEMDFKVKNLPAPKVYFAGVSGTSELKKREVLAQQKVVVVYDKNFIFDLPAPKLLSYDYEFDIANRPIPKNRSTTKKIPQRGKDILQRIRKGDKIYITNVKVRDLAGNVIKLDGVTVKVVD